MSTCYVTQAQFPNSLCLEPELSGLKQERHAKTNMRSRRRRSSSASLHHAQPVQQDPAETQGGVKTVLRSSSVGDPAFMQEIGHCCGAKRGVTDSELLCQEIGRSTGTRREKTGKETGKKNPSNNKKKRSRRCKFLQE